MKDLFSNAPAGTTEIVLWEDGDIRYATKDKIWVADKSTWINRVNGWATLVRSEQHANTLAIQNAIIHHKGVWPDDRHDYMFTTASGWNGGPTIAGNYRYADIDGSMDNGASLVVDNKSWEIVCSRKEFEATAKQPHFKAARKNLEREWITETPPPIGTKCKYSLNDSDSWWNCEIISHNRLVILCPHLKIDGNSGLQVVGETNTVRFKPGKPAISKSEYEKVAEFVDYLGNYNVKKDFIQERD